MKKTKIQWCHSTINPVMGCDGCELWPSTAKVKGEMAQALTALATDVSTADLRHLIDAVVGDDDLSGLYSGREAVATELASRLNLGTNAIVEVVNVVRRACKCYAGLLGTNRAGNKGYADAFVQPKLFPDRMDEAARWESPTADERQSKPWLEGAPRMVFVSDMGDALSRNIPFNYLKKEIIDVVTSKDGSQHLWLWLSKRPSRMAEFGEWLLKQGAQWPDNLVAMSTVTSQATAGRVTELRKVPSKFKGLSIEPLFTEVNLDLTGIDWCIVGGGSDTLAEAFQVEWALSLRDQSKKAGTAFFLKQLGNNPTFKGQSVDLKNGHGGDWEEWDEAWRIREIPAGFRRAEKSGS